MNIKNKICPICKSLSFFIFNSKHNKNIFNCINPNCGHFFTPVLNLSQGICNRDEDIEKESDHFLKIFDERNIRLFEFLKTHIPLTSKKIKLLDFGAGNAHVSRTFKRILHERATVYCLESNPFCKNFYSKFNLIQIEKIMDAPNDLDLVYMIEVIEHLIDPLEALSGIREKLKDDGLLFLSTPCGGLNEKNTNAFDTPSHLHFFTEKSLNLTLKKVGFEPIIFNHIPQMYPLPSKKFISISYAFIKNLLKKLIFFSPRVTKIHHLVGITKPLKDKNPCS
jgi:SAM-dependent methyltransferase